MTISRWKIMACTLGLSVGGLAVCVGQSNNQLHKADPKPSQPNRPTASANPDKPVAPSNAPDTLPPLPSTNVPVPVPPVQEFELDLPMPPQPQSPVLPIIAAPPVPIAGTPVTPVAHRGKDVLPKPREIDSTPVAQAKPIPETGLILVEPVPETNPTVPPPNGAESKLPISPPVPKSAPEKPARSVRIPANLDTDTQVLPPRKADPAVPPPIFGTPDPVLVEPKPPVSSPEIVPTTKQAPDIIPAPPKPEPKVAPRPTPAPVRPAATVPVAQGQKLKLLLRMGVGNPRFEIRNATGEDLLLKVLAEKIEMKSAPEGVKSSPLAGVTASGKVKFTGPGIEGTCDELSILSGTGEVLLKGNVRMKTKLKAKNWSELTADKMIYQIGSSGMTTGTATERSTFTPVEYHENH